MVCNKQWASYGGSTPFVGQCSMTSLYKMLNTDLYERRKIIVRILGEAVVAGNESYTAEELGDKAIKALEASNFEIIWLGQK